MEPSRDIDPVEPPALQAQDSEQREGLRDDQLDVLQLWLSSLRAPYRRAVLSRTSLMPFQ